MRGRKKSRPEEKDDPHRWVISYADFITLLFAFFVVMYAISSVNVSKYKSLAEGMQSAFNNKNKNKAMVSTDNQQDGAVEMQSRGGKTDDFDTLSKALTQLEDSNYKISKEDGWIEIDITGGALFKKGSVEMRPVALLELMKLANTLKNLPYPVAVEGHTDNLPIDTPQFPSNWELSAARAASVARILNIYGVESHRLSVAGYGDQHPKASNRTEWGRRINRRVNIIIAKDRSVSRLTKPEVNEIPKAPAVHKSPEVSIH